MSTSLEREIERRRRRAAELGVGRLICGLYFDRGLRYYVSWSKTPEFVYQCISQASEPERGCLDFTLLGQKYSIRTKDKSYSYGQVKTIALELWQDDQLVFGQDVDEYDDVHAPRTTTAFVEGPWIAHFRKLEREANAVHKRFLQRTAQGHVAAEAARFGIGPSQKSFVEGDLGDAAGAVVKVVVVGPFVLAVWVIKVLVPLVGVLAIVGLLLFGLRQL